MNPSRGPKVPPRIGPAAYGAFARMPAAFQRARGGRHRGKPRRVAREEEVAGLPVQGRLADLVREGVEDGHRGEGHGDVDLSRELGPDAAVRLRRRAASGQGLLLDQADAGPAEAREMERDAAADDSGADDRDVRVIRHPLPLAVRPIVSRTDNPWLKIDPTRWP